MSRANEPAFPAEESHATDGTQQIRKHLGLTIREQTAIMMAQGIIASGVVPDAPFAEVADHAIEMADALLAKLTVQS